MYMYICICILLDGSLHLLSPCIFSILNGNRFVRVFTKLRALGLTDYAKVVMLDVDLLVTQNIDDLFDLPAPAALMRGPYPGLAHGEYVDDGSLFGNKI